ncbi:hypothetical protein [Stackebrandtia soli]|uniref:hypothetical protein n=1 Tax=Stackebrandtia soli TaxID=1892856 RepID=UPI0039EA7E23
MNIDGDPVFAALIDMVDERDHLDVSRWLGWDGVAIAGRGIAAYAAVQLRIAEARERSAGPDQFAGLRESLKSIMDPLPGAWRWFDEEAISWEDFMALLTETVERLEAWPSCDV